MPHVRQNDTSEVATESRKRSFSMLGNSSPGRDVDVPSGSSCKRQAIDGQASGSTIPRPIEDPQQPPRGGAFELNLNLKRSAYGKEIRCNTRTIRAIGTPLSSVVQVTGPRVTFEVNAEAPDNWGHGEASESTQDLPLPPVDGPSQASGTQNPPRPPGVSVNTPDVSGNGHGQASASASRTQATRNQLHPPVDYPSFNIPEASGSVHCAVCGSVLENGQGFISRVFQMERCNCVCCYIL
jgi:hypothetical protein